VVSSFTSFAFQRPSTSAIYTLSLHDALPISAAGPDRGRRGFRARRRRHARPWRRRSRFVAPAQPCHRQTRTAPRVSLTARVPSRSEEHTSELQSRENLVCRLLLEKKKKRQNK